MSTLAPPSPTTLKTSNTIEAKVVILGTQGVGKTSLVLQHVGNTFTASVSPTIGASFFTFSMTLRGYKIKLQLWDTAGQERFRSMAPMYYRRANAAMIVYDVTKESTFVDAKEWVKELENKVDTKLALCVVGNKSDLFDQREVSHERGEDFAQQLGAMFAETSAASNTGVKEAFLKLAQGVVSLHQHDQLCGPLLEPSYSPINSYNTQNTSSSRHQVTNGHKDLQNHEPITVTATTDDSLLSRCCS